MRFTVNMQVVEDDGTPVWGYFHEEVFVLGDDPEKDALMLSERLFARIKEGQELVHDQIRTSAPQINAAQAEVDRRAHGRRGWGPLGR